jgi:hypothetical protein
MLLTLIPEPTSTVVATIALALIILAVIAEFWETP